MVDLKADIIERALDQGFIKVGFTHAGPLIEVQELLRRRVAQGKITSFESRDIELRTCPQAVWPPCQTVVVLAHPLPVSAKPQPTEGVLARSAVGEDYHRVVARKVERLIEELQAVYPFEHSPRYQVDTGPLNERGLALRAGVGWIGKNQQLIIPGYGSFVALALLLLDVKLSPDKPLPDQCGNCENCLKVCPAGILGKEDFEPQACLSYLTQKKERLAPEEIRLLQGRIFGCDTCQEVCPHNYRRLQEEDQGTHGLRRGVDLKELLNLTKGEFNKKYRFTAAGWRGKGVLQRNAFLALQAGVDPDFNLEQWIKERHLAQSVPVAIKPYLNCETKVN